MGKIFFLRKPGRIQKSWGSGLIFMKAAGPEEAVFRLWLWTQREYCRRQS